MGPVPGVSRVPIWSGATFEQLKLPDVVRDLAEEDRGIVLVTGTTGSGRSTALAAMVRHINATMRKHVVTIEDPIEYLYRDELSGINQREIGSEGEVSQLPDTLAEGSFDGMETLDQALHNAVRDGGITLETGTANATRPHDFKLLVQGEGRLGTTMDDVMQQA